MTIDIVTIFPEMFAGPFDASILRRAQDKSLVEINVHDLRDWAMDKHGTVDDRPYGGGPGMILRVDVLDRAISEIKEQKTEIKDQRVVLLSPQGHVFDQEKAIELSKLERLILIAGHYEGVDGRVRKHLADEELSIGDYVLTGGELPAMVVVDAVVRLLPGALGAPASLEHESFSHRESGGKLLLDYPQYTRPENYKGWKVPEVLLTGNHKEITKWRNEQAKEYTRERRPDLLK